ncbi:hypothetical protein ABZ871_09555 [Streptomyces populi]
MTVERHVLESLPAGDDEASVRALATLRGGATCWVGDRAQPAGAHAGVFSRRLQRMRTRGFEPLGLERAVRLVREHGRPVRTGLIDAVDRTWTTLLFLTEGGGAPVAWAGRPPPRTSACVPTAVPASSARSPRSRLHTADGHAPDAVERETDTGRRGRRLHG